MSPTSNTTYYHCDSCREMNSGPFSTCPACRKILCPKCNYWGLCPDHFAALPPEHQNDLQLYDRDFQWARFHTNLFSGFGAGFIFVFAFATVFLLISGRGGSYGIPNAGVGASVALVMMWGPGLLLAMWGIWRSRRFKPTKARAALAIVELLQQHPDFERVNWGTTTLKPVKAKAVLQSRHLLTGDGVPAPIEITPPINVAKNPINFRGTTGKCWTCGGMLNSYTAMFSCFQCGAILCASCHRAGLCPDHDAQLTFQQRADMDTCLEERRQVKKRMNRPLYTWALPTVLILMVVFPLAIAYAGISTSAIPLFFIFAGLIWCVLVGVIVKLIRRHHQPALDRVNLAIRALLDDIPALAQVRPTFHAPPIVIRKDDGSGASPVPLTPFPEARIPVPPTYQVSREKPVQEIPLWQADKTLAEWKRLVNLKFPVRYCPHCKMEHPAFAQYCILCGKPLPNPS